MSFVDFFVGFGGGAAGGLAVAAYLTKRLVELRLNKELERYKSELDSTSAHLKTELAIYAHEQNVGLSRLDAQRSQAIEGIYRLITRWHELFLKITSPDDHFEEDAESEFGRFYDLSSRLAKSSDRLSAAVRNRAIYFDQSTYEKISNYAMALGDISVKFFGDTFEDIDLAQQPDYEAVADQVRKARSELYDAAKGKIDDLRNTLLIEFRLLMKAQRDIKSTA